MQIIPAINVDSFGKVRQRLNVVEPLVNWVQLDVSDGTFGSARNWNNPSDLENFKTSLKLEAHLMMADIEEKIENWLKSPVQRIIFHLETAKNAEDLINKIKETRKEIGIAIAPDTLAEELFSFYPEVNFFQILAVNPGLSGQRFQEKCLQKIKDLRKNCPDAIIEVDGGINFEVGKKVKEAGADIICVASYIFNSRNIKKVIEDFKCI